MTGITKFLPRRRVLAGSTMVLAAPFVARYAIAQGMAEISTLRSIAKSWIWGAEDFAHACGYFEKMGVSVKSSASNRGTNIAALQGGVDVVLGSMEEPVRSRAQGMTIRTFTATCNKWASHLLLKKEILDRAGVTQASPLDQKLAMLKGIRLGTTGPGAAPDAMARYFAHLAGLNAERDLRLVTTGNGPPQIAATQQGAIDGFIATSPTSDIATQRAGCAYLFQNVLNPPPQIAEFQYIVSSTHEQTLKTKRDALVRYTQGLALALRRMREDPAAFKEWARVTLFADTVPDLFEEAYANNSKIFFAEPRPNEELFKRNLVVTNTVNGDLGVAPIPDSVTFASLFDTSISDDALRNL